MTEFKTDFQGIDKDIDRWMALHGTPDRLSNGTRVMRGLGKASEFVINLYFEHEAWDALVDWFAAAPHIYYSPDFTRLSDALARRGDVRRSRRLWSAIIAEQKIRFWEFHAFRRREDALYDAGRDEPQLAADKAKLLETLERARDLMTDLGAADDARRLEEDIGRIQREERGKRLPKPLARAMDEDCFWELIEGAGRRSGSNAEQMELLLEALEAFKPGEIGKFHKMLAAKMDALHHWNVLALAHLALGGCGDDQFEYFRAWLILRGRQAFQTAVEDVERLGPELPFAQARVEGLLAIPETAYENRAGKPLRPSRKTPTRMAGDKWEESDLPSRFPILARRFASRPPA